ncbi:hypothetical protein ACWZEH_16860 [Streptomyces sp. QTS137]
MTAGTATGAGATMPYGPVAAPFGASVAYGADGAVGGRQEVLGGPPDAPSRATTRSSSAPSSAPPPFRSAPTSAAKPSISPSAEPSRAGSRPGEGRKRPGREVSVPEEQSERPESPRGAGKADPWGGRDYEPGGGGRDTGGDGVSGVPEKPGGARADAADTGPAPDAARPRETAPSVPSEVSRQPTANAATGTGHSAGPMLRILPLGSGLVLMGLGLGLAFVGLRLRRS